MPIFYVGQDYTRRQITQRVGGSMQDAFPTRDKDVVAICVHADGRNPDAPEVVLASKKPRVSQAAARLSEQGGAVPVFVFHDRNQWEFCGDFEVGEAFTEGSQFNKWAARGTRPLSDISRAILLQRAAQA